ncbi:major head protein [Pseudomonas phage PaBG]|uniref:Major capsid protein n=1 Tax=Pseudomonas phage PaBG TaxID=1335230 RepID=S5VM70_9CAUD|nr:major head protein [Pseudomonas phage PaBG]AGS81964.1 putative major capsid protein [Pseudomonas phage PaBG]
MTQHAFTGARMVLKDGSPLEDLRLGKGRELALSSSTGEINAGSVKEAMQVIGQMMSAYASGEIIEQRRAPSAREEAVAAAEARREVLREAMVDPQKWSALGASLAQQISDQADREGFVRKLMVGNTLKQGEVQRVPMPAHDTMAVVATSSSNTGYQTIRQRVFTPDEFEIQANVRVENLDIQQVNGDLLDHAYNDGLQAIMVAEDRLWKKAADQTVGVVNNLELIAGELTTKNLGRLRQQIAKWGLPATHILLANDYWADVIGSNDFATFFDPITKYDLVLNGQIGTLVGMNIITDAFRQPNQKVLNPGEIYVVSDPRNHGAYSTRGGIQSTPTNGADAGNSTRGWFMVEPFSLVLANVRSVVKGKRA